MRQGEGSSLAGRRMCYHFEARARCVAPTVPFTGQERAA